MFKRNRSFFFLFLFLLGIFTTLLTLFILFFFFLSSSTTQTYNNLNLRKNNRKTLLKYTENNPFEKRTRVGFVSLPSQQQQVLHVEDHISYFNERTGSSFIITNLGGSEYECVGSCFCHSDSLLKEERRSSLLTSSILTRGLTILLSAFTSAMAINLAKETFQTQCEKGFEDSCEISSIESEVQDCYLLKSHSEETGEQVVGEEEEEKTSVEEVKYSTKYSCRGACRSFERLEEEEFHTIFPGIDESEFYKLGYEKVGPCMEIELEKEIELSEDLQFFREGILGDQMPGGEEEDEMIEYEVEDDDNEEGGETKKKKKKKEEEEDDEIINMFARIAFLPDLDAFCRKSSLIDSSLFSEETKKNFRKGIDKRTKDVEEWIKMSKEKEENAKTKKTKEKYERESAYLQMALLPYLEEMKGWEKEIPFCSDGMFTGLDHLEKMKSAANGVYKTISKDSDWPVNLENIECIDLNPKKKKKKKKKKSK